MTRSNRKTAIIWSKRGFTKTELKCYECGKHLLRTQNDNFICSECGLEQVVVLKLSLTDEMDENIYTEKENLFDIYDIEEDFYLKKRAFSK